MPKWPACSGSSSGGMRGYSGNVDSPLSSSGASPTSRHSPTCSSPCAGNQPWSVGATEKRLDQAPSRSCSTRRRSATNARRFTTASSRATSTTAPARTPPTARAFSAAALIAGMDASSFWSWARCFATPRRSARASFTAGAGASVVRRRTTNPAPQTFSRVARGKPGASQWTWHATR